MADKPIGTAYQQSIVNFPFWLQDFRTLAIITTLIDIYLDDTFYTLRRRGGAGVRNQDLHLQNEIYEKEGDLCVKP